MAANTITYAQANPQSLLRDAMFDLLPEVQAMQLLYPRAFGMPTPMDGGQATGRTIDMTGGGPLHGKLLARSKRDLLGAGFTDNGATALAGATIGSARSKIDRFAPSEIAYTMLQYSGFAQVPMHHVTNGFLDPAREEVLLVQRSAASIMLQLENYAAKFFCGVAADNNGISPGWTELDWQNAAVGGTDLDSSEDAMDVLHSIIAAARLRSGSPINALYTSRPVIDKLSRESSVLGRVFVRNGGAAAVDAATENLRVGGFQGSPVLPHEATIEIMKQHLGLDEIIVSGAMQQTGAALATRSYVFPSDRLWLGTAGETSISMGQGASPRVVSGAGSFCMLMGKSEVVVAPEQTNAPQSFEAISEIFATAVALDLEGGTVVHNLG